MINAPQAPHATLTFTERFLAVVAALCESVYYDGIPKIEPYAKLHLICLHIQSFARRFLAILAKPTRTRKPAAPTESKPRASKPKPIPGPPPEYGLPNRFAWLSALSRGPGTDLAVARNEFIDLLHDPECAALLEANPGLGRILRPLCHALGLRRPAWLEPPPPDPARPKRQRKRRPRQTYPVFRTEAEYLDYRHPLKPGSNHWPPWVKNPIETF